MSKKTEIIAIIDRSGSMASIRKDAEGGFNNFVAEQRTVPGEARLTLVDFSDEVRTVYQAKPLSEAPPYHLSPCGGTALLDAIGVTMNAQGIRIAGQQWAELVIMVIVTDGGENSSREFTSARIKEMITHAEKHGWQVIYLGANQDAFAVAGNLGIALRNTANYAASPIGTHSAYAGMSNMTQSLRTGAGGQSLQDLVDAEDLSAITKSA